MASTLPSYDLSSYNLTSYDLHWLYFPSYALQSFVLPSNVTRLIREYSKPMTRPDWRNSKPIVSVADLYRSIYTSWDEDDLHFVIYRNIKKTFWYAVYWDMKMYGKLKCCCMYNITPQDIENMGISLH